MGIPVTAKLHKDDRARFDALLNLLHDFKQILHSLRHNDEIVIKVSLRSKRQNWQDDIQK